MTAGGSKTGTEPKTPSPGPPSPAVNPVGQQGPPTDAAASTPDGARRRPWAPPIDYRDNRQTTQRWGQYWAPIGGQFCAPVDTDSVVTPLQSTMRVTKTVTHAHNKEIAVRRATKPGIRLSVRTTWELREFRTGAALRRNWRGDLKRRSRSRHARRQAPQPDLLNSDR